MKKLLLPVFVTALTVLFFVGVPSVEAQSISGNDLCGAEGDKCTLDDLKELGRRFISMFLVIGGTLLVIVLAVRIALAWFAMRTQGAEAIKKTGEQAFNALIGFLIIFLVFGGFFLALLTVFGTQDWAVKLLKLFSSSFIETAYASNHQLPNPLGSNSLYDIILSGASLIMRFFVYPAVIAMWVWSGFQFVYAQGNPEGLKKAKAWIFWAFIITVIMFSLQGFLAAFKGTAQNIVPSASQQSAPTQNGTQDGRGQPQPGAYGSACERGGFYGTIGTDGTCQVGGSR